MSDEIQVWRYALKNDEPGEGWGIFLLDSNGMLAVTSDFGNYVYHWPPQGWGPRGFRQFVIECDDGYLSGKLGGGVREYQGDTTLAVVKEYILSRRKLGSFLQEEAREEWDLLHDYKDLGSEDDFRLWLERTNLDEPYFLASYGTPIQVRMFVKRVWPRFKAMVLADLKAEAA